MKSLFVELHDRRLRYDGVSIVGADQLADLFLGGAKPSSLRVLSETEDVLQFNNAAGSENAIGVVEQEPITFDFSWKIPVEFQTLDVETYIQDLFVSQVNPSYTEEQFDRAAVRLMKELAEFKSRGMIDVLRTIIFVLHEFKRTDQVWGVGRGSSCASYVLFLLGLHVVDPILFEVDLEEFMHD